MNKKQLADFICKATDYSICSENDERVKTFLKDYDINGDDLIEEPQFLEFYLTASINKKSTVFDNLRSLGYGKDLRLKVDERKSGDFNYEETIRYKLIEHGDAYIEGLLRVLDKMTLKTTDMYDKIRDKKGLQEEKKQITQHIRVFIRWTNVLKTFINTMPPSISIVEDILFKGTENFRNFNTRGKTDHYKLVVLFGILFKSKEITKILQIMSERKIEMTPTSNDQLKSGRKGLLTEDEKLLENSRKDPWDASLPSTSHLAKKETSESLEVHDKGTLFERIATTINLEQSLQEIITKFTNQFFEKDFFHFISQNLNKNFEFYQTNILLIKLLERGLLIPRCQDNEDQARILGMLTQYNRKKKMLQKSKAIAKLTRRRVKRIGHSD